MFSARKRLRSTRAAAKCAKTDRRPEAQFLDLRLLSGGRLTRPVPLILCFIDSLPLHVGQVVAVIFESGNNIVDPSVRIGKPSNFRLHEPCP